MTDLDLFEQQLASRLRTLAPEPGPGLLDHVRVAVDSTPQRAGRWAAGPLFQTRARASGRGRWSLVGLIVALLLVATAAAVGSGAIRLPQVNPQPLQHTVLHTMVLLRGGDLFVADPDGAAQRLVRNGLGDDFASPALSPTGTAVSVLNAAGQVRVFGLDGMLLSTIDAGTAGGRLIGGYAWSPDGEQIAVRGSAVSGDGQFIALFSAKGERVWLGSPPWGYSDDATIAWSPDASAFAMAGGQGKARFSIWLVARDGSGPREIDAAGDAWLPRWSPDGRTLVVAGSSGIWTVATDNTRAHEISTLDGNWLARGSWPTDLAWSPDGKQIAAITERSLWTMRPDGTGLRLVWSGPAGMGGSNGLRWQADSRHVVLVTLGAGRLPTDLVLIDTATGASRVLVHSLEEAQVDN